jgi:hypothetical protein
MVEQGENAYEGFDCGLSHGKAHALLSGLGKWE